MNNLKFLIVKELLDELGPYESFNFSDYSPLEILKTYKSKLNGYYTIIAFEADHIILNIEKSKYDYINKNKYNHKIKEKTKKIKNIEGINWGQYDCVIFRNNILNIKEIKLKYPKTKFLLEHVEHCFKNNNNDFDVILEHNDFSLNGYIKDKKHISFPYIVPFQKLREIFEIKKENKIFFDNRQKLIGDIFDGYQLISTKRPEICYNNGFIDNNLEYIQKLCISKFFILLTKRVGQCLPEAAAYKCIVFSINIPQSKLICHPYCIINNLKDCKAKIQKIDKDLNLMKEILEYQDKKLKENYYDYQMNVINNLF